MNKLSVIILNWNGSKDTIECLKSLNNSTFRHFDVILIDNGSELNDITLLLDWCEKNLRLMGVLTSTLDNNKVYTNHLETVQTTDNQHIGVMVIVNKENLGFAGGNNIGISYALKSSYELVMLLNNDTTVETSAIGKLVEFLDLHKNYAAVSSQIRHFYDPTKIWNCGGEIKWYGSCKYFYAENNVSVVPINGYIDVTFLTGCALMFKPVKTGRLTEKYFFGEEDYEFSLRQRRIGNKMACNLESVIYHKVSSTALHVQKDIIGKTYHYLLCRMINNREYYSGPHFWLIFVLSLIYLAKYTFTVSGVNFKKGIFNIIKFLSDYSKLKSVSKRKYEEYVHGDGWR
jgi:GT2 family glycosyltransferase